MNRMKQGLLMLIPVGALVLTLAQPLVTPTEAQTTGIAPGGVVVLQGTEHLWAVDAQGRAVFVGDPQAQTRVPIDWSQWAELSRAELLALPRAAPVLTTEFVRIGNEVYLPEFTAAGEAPTLRHIKCPADLALLGVDATNYDRLVLDQATWEERYGFQT